MTVEYSGMMTIGACVPAASSAAAALSASIDVAIPDVQSRVTGLLAIQAAPPPSLSQLIAGVQSTLNALQNLVAAPLPDVAATASALAELQATLGSLSASLALADGLSAALGVAGVYYFVAAGRAGDIGGELAAHLGAGLPGSGAGSGQQVAGVMLLASDGATIAALQQVMRS